MSVLKEHGAIQIDADRTAGAPAALAAHVGKYRWTICALLFFATTLNYIDRQVLALLVPILQDPVKGIGLTQLQYGTIVSIFASGYAIGLLVAGNVIDRIGTKKGYALAVIVWSAAALSHFFVTVPAIASALAAAARLAARLLVHIPGLGNMGWVGEFGSLSGAIIGFAMVRFVLGLGEAGNFPAAIKTAAEWFPKKERSFAAGIFNAGTNIGPPIAALVVGLIVANFGWRYAFLANTAFACIWLVVWWRMYTPPDESTKLTPAELAYIQSDPPESTGQFKWSHLLLHRQTWAFLCGKLLTDPIWWFYLFWLPAYLYSKYGLTITKMVLPMAIIYNVCTIGSIFGGWLPTFFVDRGWTLNRARKTAMLIYACGIVPVIFIGHAPNIWVAIALISLATALHQAWSCNLLTLPSDMFPRRAVASVVGIGACGGALAVMFAGRIIGLILQTTHNNYTSIFMMAGFGYLIAILVIHLLAPSLSPADLE